MKELDALEVGWGKLLQLLAAGREISKDTISKIHATIETKKQELAGLDAEVSKLANMTDQNMMMPVCVRGKAYCGSVIIINAIKYLLPSEVNRTIFKLRNKRVVMVGL